MPPTLRRFTADNAFLFGELASRRSDKLNPLYYAQRTVDVASAHLWLLEGIRIDDVITMLECRRRFEIPAAIAGARAREIASTAERMIARRKTTATVRETEAEAVAFIVGQGIGLEMSRASSDYIQMYAGNAALLAESLEVVQRTSAVILSAITVEAAPEATPAAEESVAEVA